jgi:hypothetical protein
MRIGLIGWSALLALTACGGGGGGGDNVQSGPRPLDAVQNQVVALPEAQLHGVLLRAVRDAGLECQHVESAAPQPAASDGSPVYLARCTGGQAYAVGIGRGGNASVQAAAAGGQ